MRSTALKAFAMVVVLGGGVALAQTWTGSSSPEDLRYRLDVLDAELADIRARLGGSVSTPRPSPSPGGGTDLDQRIDVLEGQLRLLTGRVEQMEYRQRQLEQVLERRFGDIEFRLTELEGGDTATLGQQAPLLPQGNAGGDQTGVVQAGPTIAPGAGGQQVAAVSVSEQNDLDLGARDIQQGRFDQGENRLRTFLRTYPGSPLTGDAHYWLGESRFVRGNMQEAAKNFLESYRADVQGPRAPYALYRLGVVLGRLGQVNEACLTLREVRNQYPNGPSDVIRKADSEADNLACG